MAAPKSDMLVSTIEKCIKEYNDLQAQSKVVVAEAKLAQALDIVSRIPLDQSQYELVQVGFILRVLSESGYATKVNQLVQEWEIQCAGAPPAPIGFGEPSKAPVDPAGRLLKFVPELVRNKKICRAPPAIGFGKSGKASFELPGSFKYINEGRIRFKQNMPVFQDGKPIGAPPAVEEFLNKHMKLFQDGIIVFLEGELVFRDGRPVKCEKHGAPPVIGFGKSGKASFELPGSLKYINEGRIRFKQNMPVFQDGKPIGAPPAVEEFLNKHMKLFQDGIIVFLDGELVFRDGRPVKCQKHGAPPVIGFGEYGKAPVVPAGHLLKSVDRKTSFGIAGQLKYFDEGRIIYQRKMPEFQDGKPVGAPPAIGFGKSSKASFDLLGSLKYINEGRIRFKQNMPVFQDGKPIGAPLAVEEFLNKHMKLFQDGIIVFLDGELVFRDGRPVKCEKHGAPPVIGFGESGKAPVVPVEHLLKSVPEPFRDRKTSFGIAGQLKYFDEGRIIYQRKMPEFQDGKPVGAPPAIGFGESSKAPVVPARHLLKSIPEPVRDRKTSFGWRVSNRTHEVIPRREDHIPRWGARIPRREARQMREARNSTGSNCSL
ncbi:hypothetical protein Q3G72_006415 [Acer saccharum]|nr:hypothetical protein Q3G72_006415 [Acer saccharum]